MAVEVDLDGGFGETSPSHSAQAIAALPFPEREIDNWLEAQIAAR